MVVPGVRILNEQPGFQEQALVIIGLISNHIDGIKINLMIVFMDVAGDLEVMVEHSNRPFVFRSPGFQCSLRLAVVHKITAGATDFVHYARFWAVNIILSLRDNFVPYYKVVKHGASL